MGEEDIHTVVLELQNAVRYLRAGIDNTCRDVEDQLESIGKWTLVDRGTSHDSLSSICDSFTHYSTEMQCTNTVKEEDMAGCNLNEKGDMKEKDACGVEREASSSKMENKPTEPIAPAPLISELDVVPAVHAGVGCNACQVCSFPQV